MSTTTGNGVYLFMNKLNIKFLDKGNDTSIELIKEEDSLIFRIYAKELFVVDVELNMETAKFLLTCLNEMLQVNEKSNELLHFINRICGEMLRSDFVLDEKWYEQGISLIKKYKK